MCLPLASAQTFGYFEISVTDCTTFSLSIKSQPTSHWFASICPFSVVSFITRKLLSKLLFWKFLSAVIYCFSFWHYILFCVVFEKSTKNPGGYFFDSPCIYILQIDSTHHKNAANEKYNPDLKRYIRKSALHTMTTQKSHHRFRSGEK